MDLAQLVQFGIGGFVMVMTVIAYQRGWVYSRKSVDDLVGVYQSRIKDRDETISDLKAAFAASERRNEVLTNQVTQLVELGKTSNAVLTALPGGRAAS